jgi:hypothetical protein
MGFNMRTKLLGLERGLLIAISACILLSSGCLKKTNLEDPQVGPALDPAEVTQKMLSDIGTFSMSDMKKGEWSTLIKSRTIEETDYRKMAQQNVYIKDVISENDETTYTLEIDVLDFMNPTNSTEKITYPIKDSDGFRQDGAPLVLYYKYLDFAFYGCASTNISCHNLVLTNEKYVLRSELADPSICEDSKRCEINTKTVSMDLLVKQSDGSRQKINVSYTIAPQLPFLSRVLRYCERGVIKAKPRNFLAEDCFSISDFRPGNP